MQKLSYNVDSKIDWSDLSGFRDINYFVIDCKTFADFRPLSTVGKSLHRIAHQTLHYNRR